MKQSRLYGLLVEAGDEGVLRLVLAVRLRLGEHLRREMLRESFWWLCLRIKRVLPQSASISVVRRQNS